MATDEVPAGDFDAHLVQPVACVRCHRWIELEDAWHAPCCTRCRDGDACDNLLCIGCFKDTEGYP